jgi:hypothetical protein
MIVLKPRSKSVLYCLLLLSNTHSERCLTCLQWRPLKDFSKGQRRSVKPSGGVSTLVYYYTSSIVNTCSIVCSVALLGTVTTVVFSNTESFLQRALTENPQYVLLLIFINPL